MDQMKNTFVIPFSGPAPDRCSEVSPYIRNAPAYDRAKAQSYVRIMPELRDLIADIKDNGDLIAFGRAKPEQRLLDELASEIKKLTEGDHKVSLIMADLKTMSGVAFCPFRPMCSAG